MKKLFLLAFDIGATSGRSIIGSLGDQKLSLEEVSRFNNPLTCIHKKYYWEIFFLNEEIKKSLKEISGSSFLVDSLGIDTWGVDFVYLGADGTILGLPRSYRDPATEGAPDAYFRLKSREEVYGLTGIQIMNFNSLFQLFTAQKEQSSALAAAREILFMPDALSYLLTGEKVCEYTIASTSQLLNPRTQQIESSLLEVMGLRPNLIPPLVFPGRQIGNLTDEIVKDCGLRQSIPVIAVAGHDTASAVVAVPAENNRFAYISSGTWSLMGIETDEPIINETSYRANFTNEGGVDGRVRFLKNITGMWLLEQCRKQWEREGTYYSYGQIVEMAQSIDGFRSLIDPDDTVFAAPTDMPQAIVDCCVARRQQVPQTHAEIISCIFKSLALKYRYVFDQLREMAPFPIETMHIIGGGAQNTLLNQYTSNALNLPVVAGPCEATAIGNILMQAKGLGAVNSLSEMRAIVRNSFPLETFRPHQPEVWDEAYQIYKLILNK